jgi:hypothetical protein
MRKYLETLFTEKGISLDAPIEVTGYSGMNFLTLDVVIDAIDKAPVSEQEAIKAMIVKIDFKNGDVLHYVKHLAQALAI